MLFYVVVELSCCNYVVEIVLFNLCCCYRIWFNDRFFYILCS